MNLHDDKQRNKKFYIICTISILAVFMLGNITARFGFIIGPDFIKYYRAVKYADVYSEYAGLFQARDILMSKYNGDVDDSVLLNGAIKGMASSLEDPYTVYMDKDEYNQFNMSNSGLRVGIGVTVSVKDDKVTIMDVEEGTPADKGKLKSGDVIEKVNGEEVGNDSSKAVSLIGSSNDTVTLTILRNNEPFDVTLTKEEIKTSSVESEMVNDEVGYIKLKTFNEGSSTEFIDALTNLKNQGMKGLIFDLRSNGGGFLSEAESIASQFIPKGEVITTLDNKYGNKKTSVSKGGIAEGMPVVLLVNGNTANASEVVTGALRDYEIAQIVGENTYGKGVAQSTFGIKPTEGALKVTVDNFYTPNGENINKIGIKPDYEVALTKDAVAGGYSKDKDPQYKKALEVINEKLK